jgi:DNA-binding Xre family transcriptional regulator
LRKQRRETGYKSAYALQKALGISPTVAYRLWSGDLDKIGINTIEKLCLLFNCQPNELFEVTQTDNIQTDNTQKA